MDNLQTDIYRVHIVSFNPERNRFCSDVSICPTKYNADQQTNPVYTKPTPEVDSYRFSLRVAIASVNAKRTSTESVPNVT